MMERLREGVNSIAIKIILGLIILSFVFAGVGGYIGNGGSAAAKVNKTEIDRGTFERAYTNQRNRMQSQRGDYFTALLSDPAYVQSFRLSILDQMINDLLIEQYADSLGLRVSDNQVREQILAIPEFQLGGKFDQETYSRQLRRVGMTAEGFAEYTRKNMAREQVMSALQGSEFSLQNEINAQSQLWTQTRDIRTIELNIQEFAKELELTEEQLQEYYDAHPESYTRPEQVKVSYIELAAKDLKEQISISDERAQTYYQENLDKYATAEQRKLSHILVVGEEEAKAQAILDELNAGADFVELAKAKSEDPGSAEEGGSLGWVEKDVMDPAFEAAAFALENVGETTGLVKSGFGYHIIKLDGKKESQATPFAEVAAEIKIEVAEQEAVERFYDLQTQLETVAFEFPDSLEDAAKTVGQPVNTTDFISQADAPQLLRSPAVMQVLLSPEVKEDGLNSEVIEVAPEHVIVVRVEESRDEIVLPFAEVKAKVESELAQVKGEQKALEVANTVLDALKSGDESAVSANGLKFGELETIDRSSPLARTVYAMPKPQEGGKSYAKANDVANNIVLIELDKVSADLDSSYDVQIGAQLVRASAQQDLSSLISTLRSEADIEYYIGDVQP